MLEDPLAADVIIMDEYDAMIEQHPYSVRFNCIRGLWELRGKTVFAFSATSSPAHEKFLNSCINRPTILRFKSEYEMVKGSSPIADPTLHQCTEWSSVM